MDPIFVVHNRNQVEVVSFRLECSCMTELEHRRTCEVDMHESYNFQKVSGAVFC